MALKDYYELLEIPPGSAEPVIKKAFRKLAMRFHPDKNVGNPYAIHHFREIQEAYQVLSNPVTRHEYHQQRWHHSEMGNTTPYPYVLTPSQLEQEARKQTQYVQGLDVFRMNHGALQNKLEQLLQDSHLAILLEQQDEGINERLVAAVLQSCNPLPYPHLNDIPGKLVKIAGTNNQLITTIHQMVTKKRKQYLWEKYRALLMISIALAICIGIYAIA